MEKNTLKRAHANKAHTQVGRGGKRHGQDNERIGKDRMGVERS